MWQVCKIECEGVTTNFIDMKETKSATIHVTDGSELKSFPVTKGNYRKVFTDTLGELPVGVCERREIVSLSKMDMRLNELLEPLNRSYKYKSPYIGFYDSGWVVPIPLTLFFTKPVHRKFVKIEGRIVYIQMYRTWCSYRIKDMNKFNAFLTSVGFK